MPGPANMAAYQRELLDPPVKAFDAPLLRTPVPIE
jgi:hypothetical protein